MYFYRIAANNAAGTSTGSEASFTTTSVPPPPPPPPTPIPETLTVISTSPANGATNVAVTTAVSATFSLFVNGSTVTTDTFTLSDGSSLVSGAVSTNGAMVTFTPSSSLAHNTTYTATLTTGIRAANFGATTLDNDYTWSFTTTGDADPPTVISTSPVNGATGVAINSTITATFSETMQSSTINTDTFTVSDGSINISGTVSYSGTTATFTPSANLDFNTIYTA
ncbi:MAG: Ig-like domain-containing protein, partial [Candidatus Brocadiales bacterium]|nr:Ig-like domain-containing protein [Candidatus Brocadiales bacterium]